jgi:hypothetical protein
LTKLLTATHAKALYDYAATSTDEASLQEGQTYDIVDQSEETWWKAEQNGRVLLVPAAYLEVFDR